MEALINDLLLLAREGERVQDTQPVDLARLVTGCWQNVATSGATLQVEVDGSIEADSGRLKQLLENRFRNAIDHGPAGVTVSVGECPNGFNMADNGPGLPAESRDRIFEMGYRTSDQGTGFGLAIVAEIASAHGWKIEASDSEQGGTRFEITDVEFVE